MGPTRNGLTRRLSTIGLLSDLVLVFATIGRFFRRRSGSMTSIASVTELALAGGAALRLFRRGRRRRATRARTLGP